MRKPTVPNSADNQDNVVFFIAFIFYPSTGLTTDVSNWEQAGTWMRSVFVASALSATTGDTQCKIPVFMFFDT